MPKVNLLYSPTIAAMPDKLMHLQSLLQTARELFGDKDALTHEAARAYITAKLRWLGKVDADA